MYPYLKFDSERINAQNLASLDYALLVLKNNFRRPIKIPGKYKSGLYKISSDSIERVGEVNFTDLKDKNGVLLIGLPESEKDTFIGEGAFICEVITRFPISDSNGKLNVHGRNLVKKIFSNIIA